MKKIFFIFLAVGLLAMGCEQAKKKATKEVMKEAMKNMQPKEEVKLDEPEKYHAVVEPEMTLAEVAKANKMAESFLKQKLGIPQYVNHPYTVLQLSRNYQFTVEDLKRLIENYKDKKTARSKKAAARKKNKVEPNK